MGVVLRFYIWVVSCVPCNITHLGAMIGDLSLGKSLYIHWVDVILSRRIRQLTVEEYSMDCLNVHGEVACFVIMSDTKGISWSCSYSASQLIPVSSWQSSSWDLEGWIPETEPHPCQRHSQYVPTILVPSSSAITKTETCAYIFRYFYQNPRVNKRH